MFTTILNASPSVLPTRVQQRTLSCILIGSTIASPIALVCLHTTHSTKRSVRHNLTSTKQPIALQLPDFPPHMCPGGMCPSC
eukprot:2570394-Amphidinium_carterae.4